MNIYKKIFGNITEYENNAALVCEEEQVTYKELKEYVESSAGLLRCKGIKSKDRVMIYLNNSKEFVVSLFAINRSRGTAVLVDTKLKDELEYVITENHIQMIITEDTEVDRLKGICSRLRNTKGNEWIDQLVIISRSEIIAQSSRMNMSVLVEEGIDDSDDEALILYTSGSTGRPKGVLNSNRSLIEALDNYSATINSKSQDVFIGAIPFFHSYGLGSCLLAALVSRSKLVVIERYQPRIVLKKITRYKATIVQGVPYMYEMMLQHYHENEHCLDSVKYFISASANLSEVLARQFYQKTGKIIHQEYGSSETGTMALNLSEELELNIKSVGRPLRNVYIKLDMIDENKGIICVKKTGCGIGYLDEEPFDGEWYETNDIGYLLDDDYIVIEARKDRLINITGLKVNPEEVEACIKQHPGVGDVIVRGESDQTYGQIVRAYVVKTESTLSVNTLITYCKQHLSAYKVPSDIVWVDNIEKSGLNKSRISAIKDNGAMMC